jgi:hypothetical protein
MFFDGWLAYGKIPSSGSKTLSMTSIQYKFESGDVH